MKHPKPILILLAIGLLSLGSVGLAFGEDDDEDEGGEGGREESGWMESRSPLAPVVNATYDHGVRLLSHGLPTGSAAAARLGGDHDARRAARIIMATTPP